MSGRQVASWEGGHPNPPRVLDFAPRRLLAASACNLLNLWIPAIADLQQMGLVKWVPEKSKGACLKVTRASWSAFISYQDSCLWRQMIVRNLHLFDVHSLLVAWDFESVASALGSMIWLLKTCMRNGSVNREQPHELSTLDLRACLIATVGIVNCDTSCEAERKPSCWCTVSEVFSKHLWMYCPWRPWFMEFTDLYTA